MKKLIFFLLLFSCISIVNLRADDTKMSGDTKTVSEGNCTYTTDTFNEDGNIYEVIIDAVSNNPSIETPEACALRPVGRITFKAKEGSTF